MPQIGCKGGIYSSLCRLVILALCAVVFADPPPYTSKNADAYDDEKFGRYPEISFKTTTFRTPHLLLRSWAPSCYNEDDYYYFIAPDTRRYHGGQGPLIIDSHGYLVWHQEFPRRTFGFMVQAYKDKDYLTWWTGDDQDGNHGHGFGSNYMLDNTYRLFKKLGTHDSKPADLHEFHITKDSTVLVTSYLKKAHDLTHFGIKDGYIWDGYFQEFDPDTNELLFEWRATDHFDVRDTQRDLEDYGNKTRPFDYFHINSIDKDDHGDYLISARHCAISKIDGKSGKVIWHLGGKRNDFKDLTGHQALDFHWQHHARWTDNFEAVTIFDNHVDKDSNQRNEPSRGLKLHLDQKKLTVKAVQKFAHPIQISGEVMGSMQALDNGNYLVGYGRGAAVTEYSPNGTVVCDLGFGPLRRNNQGNFRASRVSHSYRAFKLRWKATPYYDPDVYLDSRHNKFYVSWNGATEVSTWKLMGLVVPGRSWRTIGKVPKSGFESNISVHLKQWEMFRLLALDKTESTIRAWIVSKTGIVQAENSPTDEEQDLISDQNSSGQQSSQQDSSEPGSSPEESLEQESSQHEPPKPEPSKESHPKQHHSKPDRPKQDRPNHNRPQQNHPQQDHTKQGRPKHGRPKPGQQQQINTDDDRLTSLPLIPLICFTVGAIIVILSAWLYSKFGLASIRRRWQATVSGGKAVFSDSAHPKYEILHSAAYSDDPKDEPEND